jgi:hypothetical protein
MKITTAKLLITAIFAVGMFAGMSYVVPVPSAAAVSGGLSYVTWRIDNGSTTV